MKGAIPLRQISFRQMLQRSIRRLPPVGPTVGPSVGLSLILLCLTTLISVSPSLYAQNDGSTAATAESQTQGQTIQVAIKELAPFVLIKGEDYSGFSIDYWNAIADRLGMETEWVVVESVQEQLEAVRSGAVDAAITGITITRAREETIDFSYPYFNAGLQIMIKRQPFRPLRNAFAVWRVFLSPAILEIIGIMFLILVLVAHGIWLVERHSNSEFPSGYLPGIWEAIWWAAVTVTTVGYGDKTPKGPWGRIFGLVWMFAGLFLIAQFTASITSTLAVQQLRTTIASAADLPNKRIATVEGSTSADYLRTQDMIVTQVARITEAYALLDAGDVDAVVYDSPTLQYYAATEGQGRVQLIGAPLLPERYGIALPQASSLREPINLSILDLAETDAYGAIYAKWFEAGE